MKTDALRLSAFEHLMWADDRLTTPMTFYLRLEFSGKLEQSLLRSAINAALHRHPLLRSIAVGDPRRAGKHLHWQTTNESPYFDWVEDQRPFKLPQGRERDVGIDISREIGCRFFVRIDHHHTQLLAQFHHAAVDAKGGARFLEDVLAHYHASATGKDISTFWRPLNQELLADRNGFRLSKKDLRKRRRLDLERIKMYFRLRPEIMWHKKLPQDVAVNFARSIDIDLVADEFSKLKAYAKSHGCTINDVLLRDLFLTLNTWNERHLEKRGNRCVRLAMAIDMRRLDDAMLPAANVVSMCFLDRRSHEMEDREHLLDSIRDETRHIKRHYLGMALIRAARFFSAFRGGFSLLMRPNPLYPCHSTAVLSNLGQPLVDSKLPQHEIGFRVGTTSLIGFSLLPPFRPNTPVAVGVGTVGSTLRIAMHYNAEALTADQARQLGEIFRGQLQTTLAWSPPAEDVVPIRRQPAVGGPLWALPIGKNVRPRAPEHASEPTA